MYRLAVASGRWIEVLVLRKSKYLRQLTRCSQPFCPRPPCCPLLNLAHANPGEA